MNKYVLKVEKEVNDCYDRLNHSIYTAGSVNQFNSKRCRKDLQEKKNTKFEKNIFKNSERWAC